MATDSEKLRRALEMRSRLLKTTEVENLSANEYNLRNTHSLVWRLLNEEANRANEVILGYQNRNREFSDEEIVKVFHAHLLQAQVIQAQSAVVALLHGYDHPIHDLRIASASAYGRKPQDLLKELQIASIAGWIDETVASELYTGRTAAKIVADNLNDLADTSETMNSIRGKVKRGKLRQVPDFVVARYQYCRAVTQAATNAEKTLRVILSQFSDPRIVAKAICDDIGLTD